MFSGVELWKTCCEQLKKQIGDISFNTWIAPLRFKIEKDRREVTLEVPDIFFKDWLKTHYLHQIKTLLQKETTQDINIHLVVNPKIVKKKAGAILNQIQKKFINSPTSLHLNSRYTFNNFIIGSSNRMAHAASLAVAQAPGKTYNPLFIYGKVGLGKTHLMQAIAQDIITKNSAMKVHYTSSETFFNEFVSAIQNRTMANFRKKYRELDILLIDDIHFLAGKGGLQEEFFHTFNVLYDEHKQIVVSSDRPPKEISKLEDRLVSRFSWGLLVDIQPPDFETRVAILQKKIEKEPVSIDQEVIDFIAKNITTNIRELEGALIRLIAYSVLENKKIDLLLAKEILKDMVKEIYKKITPDIILNSVANYFNLKKEDLKSTKRNKKVVLPKQITMYLMRSLTDLSLPEIGSFLGAKHHTTILYAYKKIRDTLNQDLRLKNIINAITHDIKEN